jgi:hypothetical protein
MMTRLRAEVATEGERLVLVRDHEIALHGVVVRYVFWGHCSVQEARLVEIAIDPIDVARSREPRRYFGWR